MLSNDSERRKDDRQNYRHVSEPRERYGFLEMIVERIVDVIVLRYVGLNEKTRKKEQQKKSDKLMISHRPRAKYKVN